MIRFKTRTAMIGAMLLVALSAIASLAQAADPVKLEAIDVQTLSGQQVQLKLHMSGPAPEPLPFTIDKPARIAFDLPNTALALASRRIDVRSGGVDTVLAAEANGRTRVVVNVDALLPYTTKVDGNNIIITLGNQPGEAAKMTASRAGSGASAAAAERSIRTIDFRRGSDGTGRVIVQLTDPRTPVNVRQEGNQVVVDFAGTLMPKNLMRRYDVQDFATPVQSVDAIRVEGSSRLVITALGDFEQLAYQSDNQYTVEIKPSLKRSSADEKKEYTGERLTLNFQDIDVRSVLQLLADTSGQNIVVSDSVTGNLTLRLQNVPWDQALDIVLRTKGLDKRRQDNVIIIGPTEELASREKAELAAHKEVQELSPVRSEFLQVNYAKVSDLAKLIKSTNAKESMLSARGSLAIDDRTNTLLVQDTAERLADIRRLVATLDVPIKQVLIEARIVVVSDTFERDLGAQLGFSNTNSAGANLLSVSGTAAAADGIVTSSATGATPTTALTSQTLANRYQVNLPASNINGSFGVALLSGSHLLDLQLSAAENEGKSETISSPRVITANQKQATIMQGVEIPYQESASSGATTTQFKNAVLSLKVTPLITPDNRVVMDIDVSDDTVGAQVTSATGGSVPSIDTRQILTQVLVNDGQTVVLGGILETTRSKSDTKVPFLADIPWLGNLFKSTININNKTELLIFITPKILREGSNLY
ncbi:MAG: type IV pilus secretin PilQ [Steroidobacteraceae bacterium]|jgi:type IV pilus assembly protein PilQ